MSKYKWKGYWRSSLVEVQDQDDRSIKNTQRGDEGEK